MILSDLMTELKYTGFIENPEISARIFQDLFTDLIDSTKMLLDMLKVAQISFRIFTLTLMWRIFQDCFKYFLILGGLSGSLLFFVSLWLLLFEILVNILRGSQRMFS